MILAHILVDVKLNMDLFIDFLADPPRAWS